MPFTDAFIIQHGNVLIQLLDSKQSQDLGFRVDWSANSSEIIIFLSVCTFSSEKICYSDIYFLS